MKWFAALFLFCSVALLAQQPQTHTAPTVLENAKWVNGVAPGYAPTAGSGLTLNLSAGTAFCGGSVITYAGGTLTMTGSTTNNVYLNTSSSCAPATKTAAFAASDIPIASVTTTSSITAISDLRTMFFPPGGNSGLSNVVMPPDLFASSITSGVETVTKQNVPADYYMGGASGATYLTPYYAQIPVTCFIAHTSSPHTCSTTGAVSTGDTIIIAETLTSYSGGFCGGDDGVISGDSTPPTDNLGNTYTQIGGTGSRNGYWDWAGAFTKTNATGGALTVTANASGSGNYCAIITIFDLVNGSPFDVAAQVAGSTFPSVTTTAANDIVLAVNHQQNSSSTLTPTGWSTVMPFVNDADHNGKAALAIGQQETTIGTFTPAPLSGSTSWSHVFTIAFKSATSGGGGAPWAARPIPFSALQLAAFPQAVKAGPQIVYANTATAQVAAISDTTMVTAPASVLYSFVGTVKCTTTSASATATLNLKYTDTSNTAQTVSATDTCTALVTTGVPNLNVALRAKSGTAITWGVTIANTPTYDVDVRLESH